MQSYLGSNFTSTGQLSAPLLVSKSTILACCARQDCSDTCRSGWPVVVGICIVDHCLLWYLYIGQKIGGVFGIIKRLRKKKKDLIRKNSPDSF